MDYINTGASLFIIASFIVDHGIHRAVVHWLIVVKPHHQLMLQARRLLRRQPDDDNRPWTY